MFDNVFKRIIYYKPHVGALNNGGKNLLVFEFAIIHIDIRLCKKSEVNDPICPTVLLI